MDSVLAVLMWAVIAGLVFCAYFWLLERTGLFCSIGEWDEDEDDEPVPHESDAMQSPVERREWCDRG